MNDNIRSCRQMVLEVSIYLDPLSSMIESEVNTVVKGLAKSLTLITTGTIQDIPHYHIYNYLMRQLADRIKYKRQKQQDCHGQRWIWSTNFHLHTQTANQYLTVDASKPLHYNPTDRILTGRFAQLNLHQAEPSRTVVSSNTERAQSNDWVILLSHHHFSYSSRHYLSQ